MSYIIGIDLGTSTTEAAVYRDGRPEMILNLEKEIVTPSVVGIDEAGNWVAGARAKAQALLHPDKTAVEVKRQIGKGELIPLGKQKFSPVTLSARILEYVKSYVSDYLGEEVDRAVISVPAYFNDIQRRDTLRAGETAGFRVERILNEPTAAALSYGLDHMEEESLILVYDLGGGTFDVTLLEMFDGVLEVKASSGDNELGGKDFDQALEDHLLEQFRRIHNIDLRKDRFAMVKVRQEAERCKIALSSQDEYRVLIPMIAKKDGTPVELDVTVTADTFEKLTAGLIERTHEPIDVVLHDSELSAADIDKIILVGGSTRMPMVARDIEAYLGKKPERAVDPDFAVAQGAAIQAGIISGEIEPDQGLIMTDVNPYTLGVKAITDYSYDGMSVIIPRNVTIPVTREEIYWTASDYQTEATVMVYQGESQLADSNHFLGEFELSGIPPKKAHKESISVRFSYDLNGMLDVKATVVSTGKEASIRIDMHDTAAEPEGAEKKTSHGKDKSETEDLSGWKDVPGSEDYRSIIRRAERFMRSLDGTGLRIIEHMLDMLKSAIIDEDWDYSDEIADRIRDTIDILK